MEAITIASQDCSSMGVYGVFIAIDDKNVLIYTFHIIQVLVC
jgi:hypothetical protein